MTKARSLSDFIESDGSVTLVDNQKIKVGTGNDLEIYHDGSYSYIREVGTGDLRIGGASNVQIWNSDIDSQMANFANGGAVTLYYAGATKLATTSTGVTVTGKVVTTAMEMGGGTSSASIYRTGSDGSGFHFSTNAILPADQTGAVANGTEDLGGSGNKFKDLHLSGSANVGTVVSSGSISGTSANFTNDVAINNGSPELYFGTTGAHYNWRIAAQESVDAALTIDVGSQDTDYSNDTYNSQVIVKNTGSVGLGAAPSATGWGSASRVLQITGTQPLVSLKDTDTGEIQLANSGQTFYIWDSVGSASRMQIRADGSIAIGANNAGYDGQILSVKSGANDNVFYGESTDANCIISLRDNSSTANIGYGATANAHVLSQDGTEIARFSTGSGDKYSYNGAGLGGNGTNLHLSSDDSEIKMANNFIHSDNSGLTKFTIRTGYGSASAGAELSLDGGHITFNAGTSFTQVGRFDTDGLKFNADTAAANALNDYEEGSWTPEIDGGSGGAYTMGGMNNGRYTKVGDLVFVTCTIEWTGRTTAYSGHLLVKGLPYACGDVRAVGTLGAVYSGLTFSSGTYDNYFTWNIDPSLNYAYIIQNGDGTYSHNPTVGSTGRIYTASLLYRAT